MCGKVTYSCAADPLAVALCHCTECQRQSGAAFSVNVAIPRAAFELQGESLGEFRTLGTDSGSEVARMFCRDCGSPLASLPDGLPDMALIKAGTLDDRSWLESQPGLQVWVGSAQPWVPLDQLAETTLPRGLPG